MEARILGRGHAAPVYHLPVSAFAEDCLIAHRAGDFRGPTLQFDGCAATAPER